MLTAAIYSCDHFMAMIFGDYVAGFLGLGRDGNSWSMNPFDVSAYFVRLYPQYLSFVQPIKDQDGLSVGRGEGNHCSAEFNLLHHVRLFFSFILEGLSN